MFNVLTHVKNKSFINMVFKKIEFQKMYLIIFANKNQTPSSENKIIKSRFFEIYKKVLYILLVFIFQNVQFITGNILVALILLNK